MQVALSSRDVKFQFAVASFCSSSPFSGLDPTFAQSASPIFSRSIIILTFVIREMSQFRFLPDTANYRGIGGESVIRDGSAKFWQKGGRGEMTGDRR